MILTIVEHVFSVPVPQVLIVFLERVNVLKDKKYWRVVVFLSVHLGHIMILDLVLHVYLTVLAIK